MIDQDNNKEINGRDDDGFDFSCQYTSNLPTILKHFNLSLAFTSYQAGRLMLVRSTGETLDINYKAFPRPMGLTTNGTSLTLGIFTQVVNFSREDGLLPKIKQPLQKIEDDITAPRIRNNEDEKAGDEAAQDPSDEYRADEQPANEHAVANEQGGDGDVLTEERRQKYEERRQRMRDYQEALFAPVDECVDACFITRSSHHSGMINIHDIEWGNDGLWAVNSSFSCLCTLEPDFSFVPRWKPHFISELVPEDRCHLNGMALRDGEPAYVTTFSKKDAPGRWREEDGIFDGTLMDVKTNAILVDGLAMPHSPRWYQGKVYFCESGEGLICSYDPTTGRRETVAEVPGFTRGMDFYGPLMFVGLSRVRQSDVSRPAPLASRFEETHSGLWVINLEDNSVVGEIRFTGNVDQIYDVAVLTGCHYPELIEPSHPRMRNHFCYPDTA